MELETVKEGMVHSLGTTKFMRKATKDMESMANVDEVIDLETLLIGKPYFFKLFHCFFNIVSYLQVKKAKKDLVEIEGKHPMTEEDVGHGGVTIKSSEECRPHNAILNPRWK